jgi:hypothetical protein
VRAKVVSLSRKHEVSTSVICNWRSKPEEWRSATRSASGSVEDAGRQLKQMPADPSLDTRAFKSAPGQKVQGLMPNASSLITSELRSSSTNDERASWLGSTDLRSVTRAAGQKPRGLRSESSSVSGETETLLQAITILFRRDGFPASHERIYRINRTKGLSLRKRRKLASPAAQQALTLINGWSMEVPSDSFVNSRTMRVLTAVDDSSFPCVALEFGQALPAERVTRILDMAIKKNGTARKIQTEIAPEFISKASDAGGAPHEEQPTETRQDSL